MILSQAVPIETILELKKMLLELELVMDIINKAYGDETVSKDEE